MISTRRAEVYVRQLERNIGATANWFSELRARKLRTLLPIHFIELLKRLSIHDLKGTEVRQLPPERVGELLDSLPLVQHKLLARVIGKTHTSEAAFRRTV